MKANEVPKSYEEMAQRKQWKGKIAIDGTDGEWLRGLVLHFGEQKGLQIAKDLAANLDPILTVGHLALVPLGRGRRVCDVDQQLHKSRS